MRDADPPSWDDRFISRIAAEIRRLRTEQGMSAQGLADKISEQLHFQISRATISDIENGRRKYITAAELLLFAEALHTAPVLLLFPGPFDEVVEAVPGVSGTQMLAVKWVCGELSGYEDDEGETYRQNLTGLRLARELDELEDERRLLIEELGTIAEDNSAATGYHALIARVNRRIAETRERAAIQASGGDGG